MRRQLLLLLLAFVLGSVLAGLLGAANLGVALSIGSFCFLATLVFLMLTD